MFPLPNIVQAGAAGSAAGGSSSDFPGYYPGQRFSNAITGCTTSNNSTALGTSKLFITPLIIRKAVTLDRIGVYETGSTPADTHKLAIYDNSRNLIASLGTIATVQSSGLREVAISQAVASGLYFIAVKSGASWGLSCETISSTVFTEYHSLFSFDTWAIGTPVSRLSDTHANAFPSALPEPNETATGFLMIALRAA